MTPFCSCRTLRGGAVTAGVAAGPQPTCRLWPLPPSPGSAKSYTRIFSLMRISRVAWSTQ